MGGVLLVGKSRFLARLGVLAVGKPRRLARLGVSVASKAPSLAAFARGSKARTHWLVAASRWVGAWSDSGSRWRVFPKPRGNAESGFARRFARQLDPRERRWHDKHLTPRWWRTATRTPRRSRGLLPRWTSPMTSHRTRFPVVPHCFLFAMRRNKPLAALPGLGRTRSQNPAKGHFCPTRILWHSDCISSDSACHGRSIRQTRGKRFNN